MPPVLVFVLVYFTKSPNRGFDWHAKQCLKIFYDMSNIFLWSYGSTIFIQETQIGYTQYVGNDVYVDDVDADEAGAAVYFVFVRQINV